MKTTVEISDALLAEAKAVAAREGITLKVLVETGLRQVLQAREARPPYRLRRATFRGEGLREEWREADWADLRDAAYKGRGG
ncbi:MAG TPA: DUF2191 domain-containing protein [bacterium]